MPTGLFIRYGPDGVDIQADGPGYVLGSARASPHAVIVEHDAPARRLVIRADLFGVHAVHVLVRDKRLWAADSLARLRAQADVPRGMLPLGAAVGLCVAPAQRPSLFACGLGVIGGSTIECTPQAIRTTPYWSKSFDSSTHEGVPAEQDIPHLAQTIENEMVRQAKDALWLGPAIPGLAHPLAADAVPPEEDLPAAFEEAVGACESLLADDHAAANLLKCRAAARAGHRAVVSAVGARAMLAQNLQQGADGLPRFIARHACDNVLALKLLKPEYARRVKFPDWSRELAGEPTEAARRSYIRSVLLPGEVPAYARTAAAAGLEFRAPLLAPDVAMAALKYPAALLARRFAVEDRPCPPPGGISARARANWIALYDKWLSGDRLEALEIVDVGRVRELLIAYAKLHSYAPPRAAMDRVLKKLTSLTILHAQLA